MTLSEAQKLLRICKRQARLNPGDTHWVKRIREWEVLIASGRMR